MHKNKEGEQINKIKIIINFVFLRNTFLQKQEKQSDTHIYFFNFILLSFFRIIPSTLAIILRTYISFAPPPPEGSDAGGDDDDVK